MTPLIHLPDGLSKAHCGKRLIHGVQTTFNPERVTCGKCRKRLAKLKEHR